MRHSPLLSPRPHAFTGVGDGDLRPGAPGQPEAAARLLRALGGRELRVVSQVHGARVLRGEEATPADEADALISTTPGVLVAVRVADCVPVLLSAPGGVAAVHAGWRGTVAGIAVAGLDALCAATGARPDEVRAAVGPAICGRCYEVGAEVLDAVASVAVDDSWRAGPRHVDLQAVNAGLLRARGVEVEVVAACTRCGEGFWSHRRDGAAAGRQAGVIGC